MNRENPQANDEEQMRAFWRQWNKRITKLEAEKEKRNKLGRLKYDYNSSRNRRIFI